MILINTEAPGFGISLPLLAGLAAASLAFTQLVLRLALISRRRPVVCGREDMLGASGRILDWGDGAGHVFTHSERWRAVSDAPLTPGDRVRTLAVKDLTLTVAPDRAGDPPPG